MPNLVVGETADPDAGLLLVRLRKSSQKGGDFVGATVAAIECHETHISLHDSFGVGT